MAIFHYHEPSKRQSIRIDGLGRGQQGNDGREWLGNLERMNDKTLLNKAYLNFKFSLLSYSVTCDSISL